MFQEYFLDVNLPSKGIFYENGCKQVKLSYMNASDEAILMNPTLISQKRVIDELLRRKVMPMGEGEPFVDTSKMLWGDLLALLLALRTTMDSTYRFKTIHPKTGKEVVVETNLGEMELKPFVNPNSKGFFDMVLPISQKSVEFKLLTADVDKIIKKKTGDNSGMYKLEKAKQLIVSIDGDNDIDKIKHSFNYMNTKDLRALSNYIDEVTPTFDLNVKATVIGGASNGDVIDTFLTIGGNFFYE